MHVIAKRLLALCCTGLLAAACDAGTDPGVGGTLAISVTAAQNGAAGSSLTSARDLVQSDGDLVQSDGTNTLTLSRIAIVFSEIELERSDESDCDDDNCEEFEFGPLLLEVDLDGAVEQVVSAVIPAGSYDELEFEIEKPGDDSHAAAFIQQNPDFRDVSIRVEGMWNAEAFVFVRDLDQELEFYLSPALVIEEGSSTPANLTLSIDVAMWFTDSAGALIDPRTAVHGGPNEELVERNIKRSMDAFEDDDRDGEHH